MASPSEAKSRTDVLRLRSTFWKSPHYWVHLGHDGAVHLCQQQSGLGSVASISIPRRTFAGIVEWYLRDQK